MNRSELIAELTALLGAAAVIHQREALVTYDCDANTIDKADPDVVVLPRTTDEVSAVVRLAHEHQIPFVARGAGTGLSGGAIALRGGIMIALTRMKAIEWIDLASRQALVQVGLVNLHLTNAVKANGYCYAPDPSSQGACTIGGNVAENSGGPHTLKFGVTTNHVLALEVVLPTGEVVWLGGAEGGARAVADAPGYDLTGVFVGSEGTFGIATRAIVRLVHQPERTCTLLAIFDRFEAGAQTVSAIIAAGIIPAALEMIDQPCIVALEETFKLGFPLDAEAILLVETDGQADAAEEELRRVIVICNEQGAREVRVAQNEQERMLLWKARKGAFAALSRLAKSYYTQDGVVPRSKLPEILRTIRAIGERYRIRIANVFHAGDGNLHPCLLFDEQDPDEVQRCLDAGADILKACVDIGGSVTGEHGIGVEKIELMNYAFTPATLQAMRDLRSVFNPDGLCNPLKVVPINNVCVERRYLKRAALAV